MTNLSDASDMAESDTPRDTPRSSPRSIGEDWANELCQVDEEAVADLLAEMESSHAALTIPSMETSKAARCLANMKAEVSPQIIERMSIKLAAKLLKDMQPPDAGEIFRDMYSGYSKSIVGILNQMSIEVANEILSEMDLAARIGIVGELCQSCSSHSQQSVISEVPLLRPGVLAEKEEWANFTSNQASDPKHRGTQLCVDFLDPMQIERLPTPLRQRLPSMVRWWGSFF